jgi:hypothetical protein
MFETGLKSMMTNVYGKVFKNLRHEMFVHLLRINASVKRVALCLMMNYNLKIAVELVLAQSD